MSKCKHCGLDTTDMTGSQKANHSRWCDKNPKVAEYKDKLSKARDAKSSVAWNKGLTKDTDERVAKYGKTNSDKLQSGEASVWNKGTKMSQNQKDKISETQRKNNYERVNKNTQPYTTIDGDMVMLDSSWEVKVAKELDDAKIKWIRPKPLKWYDKNGWIHNYFPDFYIPDWNVYLDPKNDWVIEDQKEKWNYLNKKYNNIFILKENQLNLKDIKKVIGII